MLSERMFNELLKNQFTTSRKYHYRLSVNWSGRGIVQRIPADYMGYTAYLTEWKNIGTCSLTAGIITIGTKTYSRNQY